MSYKAGIVLAIDELKDRMGSSMVAIKKHMQANMPSDKKWLNATFLTALKSGVAAGDLIKVKNSYKLSPEFKKKRIEAAKPKKVAPKKKAASKKKTAPKKKAAPKKKVAPKKKATTKKSAPKKKATAKKSAPKKKTSTKKSATKKKTTPKKK
mmetsp:Transcript_18785/g.27154  ORF Transcript_18785/g.27154 Transcript_18785/m.27154 type:complete len:152 (-) Transcript_18785:529-984(-)